VVRYADDFVVLHPDLAIIEEIQQRVSAWLAELGLELKSSKTGITHTLHEYQGRVGFDFLGFTVRQFPVGKTHSGKSGGHGRMSTPLGFKTLIRPSKEAQRRHLAAIAEIIRSHRTAPQGALVSRLNPLIRGWTNYFATKASQRVFSRMTDQTYRKLHRWAKRRHRNKSWSWIASKYWRRERGTWEFGPKEGPLLHKHYRTPIRRHVKVQGTRSPYDGDWVYWGSRLGAHPELPRRVAMLLRRQGGRCTWCGLYFKDGDLLERDHVLPVSRGGEDGFANWQLLHRHCHDAKTVADGSVPVGGAHVRSQTVEEPDEAKASRPVLETSRSGDRPA